jgi:multidrug efflux system membrane fusion protein
MILKNSIKYITVSFAALLLLNNTVVNAEEYEAFLHWSKRAELSTPVNGVVQEVFAQVGKIVPKGEVLIQLDPRIFKADLSYAQALLRNTDDKAQEAKRELDRQTDMYDRTMLSEHELQVAKNNFTEAKSQFQQAKASLTKAKLNLEYSAIRAPFNAIVISTSAVKGQVVASEITPPILVTVAEAKRMLARIFVTVDKLSRFVINQGAKVNVAGQTFQGKVLNIAFEADAKKAGYYAVDVIFDTKEVILRAGQQGTVEL